MYCTNFDLDAADRLKRQGWTLLSRLTDQLAPENEVARRALVDEAKAAPLDPFCLEGFRSRYYHQGYLLDGQFLLEPTRRDQGSGLEVVPFDQGDANPDFAGKVRMMPAMPWRIWSNPAFRELQERCLRIARQALGLWEAVPMAWECHMIRLVAPAVSSPDVIHFDDGKNRMITFIIVIERESVVGGVNMITARHCAGMAAADVAPGDVYFEGVIERPFDGYAFIDSRIAHYVSGVRPEPGAIAGARTILIFDFVKLIREPIAIAA